MAAAVRGRGDELNDPERTLHARARLDAARDIDPEGTHRADRRGDVGRVQAAGEYQLRVQRELPRRAPVARLPAAAGGPSNSMRGGKRRRASALRSTGRSSSDGGRRSERDRPRRSAARRAGTRAGSHRAPAAAGGVSPPRSAPGRAPGRASCAAGFRGDPPRRGGEHEADRVDARLERGRDRLGAVVMPQILIHIGGCAPSSQCAARAARPARSSAAASPCGSSPRISALPTSARS